MFTFGCCITVRCYISVAEKHKTMLRFMTEINKYKQIIEFNPITAIEYSSCYNLAVFVMYLYCFGSKSILQSPNISLALFIKTFYNTAL